MRGLLLAVVAFALALDAGSALAGAPPPKPPPPPPVPVTLEVTPAGFVLRWTDRSDDETEFAVSLWARGGIAYEALDSHLSTEWWSCAPGFPDCGFRVDYGHPPANVMQLPVWIPALPGCYTASFIVFAVRVDDPVRSTVYSALPAPLEVRVCEGQVTNLPGLGLPRPTAHRPLWPLALTLVFFASGALLLMARRMRNTDLRDSP